MVQALFHPRGGGFESIFLYELRPSALAVYNLAQGNLNGGCMLHLNPLGLFRYVV